MFFFGSFVFFVSCLRFLSPLILCWFAVILWLWEIGLRGRLPPWLVQSVWRFFCLFVCLFVYILCKYTRKRICIHTYGNTMAWATALANTACNLYKVNNLHVETTQSLQRQH